MLNYNTKHTISTMRGSVGFGEDNNNRTDVKRTHMLREGCQLPYIIMVTNEKQLGAFLADPNIFYQYYQYWDDRWG